MIQRPFPLHAAAVPEILANDGGLFRVYKLWRATLLAAQILSGLSSAAILPMSRRFRLKMVGSRQSRSTRAF
ncbi:MAG TPA: hypothetical protein VHZ55_09895 [Bryobacteraceae bacterium]|nr:hypothetical protein [Bryobacteraceae bacterium]